MKTNITPRSTTPDPVPGAGTGIATPAIGDRPGEKSLSGDGDPIRYTPEFAILVCERIASSPRSILSVCCDPDMPSRATLFRWLRDHPDFREIYREAKEAQADILIEEGLDIIDDDSNDVITTADGRTIINMAAVHRSKAQVDYRKWIASKFLPRKYGSDRQISASPASHHPKTQPPYAASDDSGVTLSEEMRMVLIEERRRRWEAAEAKQEQEAATKAAADAARAAALAQKTGIEDSTSSPDAPPPRSHSPIPNHDFRTAISDRPSPKKARQEYDLSPIPERPARHEQCPAFHSGRYI
jgi:hypothetical protein